MDLPIHFEPWWRFGAALLVGALIGLEREFVQQKSGEFEFAGLRTFSLLALFGAIAAYFALQHGIILFVIAYLGIAFLIWGSLLGQIYHKKQEGITTEVVALLVPFLGAMIIWNEAELAGALGVIVAMLLAFRSQLHRLARKMSSTDLRAMLEFALITAVILPILPNENYGPFDVLNPYEIWLLVVLVSGISFLGYILMKLFGAARGIGLTGLLGGLVSSTAVTLSFSGRSKEEPGLSPVFAYAILLASSVMFPRVLIEIMIVHSPLLRLVIVPIGSMFLAGLICVAVLWRRQTQHQAVAGEEIDFTNPLKISTAISFGLLFAIVLMAFKAANQFLGDAGVYAASALSGLADVDALTLSVSDLTGSGQMQPQVAAIAILIGVLVNTVVKGATAALIGSPALKRIALITFGVILAVGIISAVITFWIMV